MSWESSAEYYRLINERIKARLGPAHSAELVMVSLDFQPIAQLELAEHWDELALILVAAIARLEKAGAQFVIMASNTAHRVADTVQKSIHIPLIHIADVAADAIRASAISTLGLLGTCFVMEQEFYRERFRRQGIAVLIPDRAGRSFVHDVIYNELCAGKLVPESRERTLTIMSELQRNGAEAIVLACTELPLLIRAQDTTLRLFDTMALHVEKAVTLALAK